VSAPNLNDGGPLAGHEGASVLVTGASGFVGTHLCAMLADHGWRVVAASRSPVSDFHNGRIKPVVLSLSSDPSAWQSALSSVHCVLHLAAHVHRLGRRERSATTFDEVNVQGSRFVAEQAAQARVRRLVYLSSIKVNGEGAGDTAYRPQDVPLPTDAYGESKWKAELALHEVCARETMELIVIRPPLVYGPGVRANFRRLMRWASLGVPLPFASIDNRRSLVNVWNLAHFIETCLIHAKAPGNTFLLSDGEDLSTPALIRKISRLMDKPARLFAFPPRAMLQLSRMVGLGAEIRRLCESLRVDSTEAQATLGWRPIVGVEEGLARTVAAYRRELNR